MAEDSRVMEVTDENFTDEIVEADGLAMVDFWATWCGPCRIVAPVVEELAGEYADRGLKVGKLDVDTNQQTSSHYGIRSIPTILFFKNGKMVDRVIGAVPKPHLEQKIQEHLEGARTG
ncbi:MAG: thioredoxin [Gemmatimonadota bacterium]